MNNRRQPQTYEELVAALEELFDNTPAPETKEEIETVLVESGYDPESVAQEMRAVAAKAFEQSPFNWRNRARGEMEDAATRFSNAASVLAEQGREQIIAQIRALSMSSGGQPTVSTHYRNLDEKSDEDLRGLLEELQFLSEIEQSKDGDEE